MPTAGLGLPWSPSVKESACQVEDVGLIPGGEDPLEKEMATYSSILAWKIPWTEEPGRLQFVELQKLWHDLAHKHMCVCVCVCVCVYELAQFYYKLGFIYSALWIY